MDLLLPRIVHVDYKGKIRKILLLNRRMSSYILTVEDPCGKRTVRKLNVEIGMSGRKIICVRTDT